MNAGLASAAPVTSCKTGSEKMDLGIRVASPVFDYYQFAAQGKAKEAESAYQSLHGLLFDEIGENNECFEAASTGYIRAVFIRYFPGNVSIFNRKYNKKSGGMDSFANEMAIFNALEGRRVFAPLTNTKRNELGAIWSQVDSNTGEYAITGGYDCASLRIYYDPHLRPFDLLTTLYHEIDHLYRDRTLRKMPTQYEGDWAAYNFADEVQAIGTSSSVYLGLALAKNYRGPDDFSFFSKTGPVTLFARQDPNYTDQIAEDLVEGTHGTPELVRNFYSSIWSGYFPEQTLPENYPKVDKSLPTIRRLVWDPEQFAESGDGIVLKQTDTGLEHGALDGLVADIFSNPGLSRVCQAHIDSIKLNPADHYLGTNLSSQSVVHPCLNFHGKL